MKKVIMNLTVEIKKGETHTWALPYDTVKDAKEAFADISNPHPLSAAVAAEIKIGRYIIATWKR